MRITGLRTFVAQDFRGRRPAGELRVRQALHGYAPHDVPLFDGSTDMCFAADGAVVMNETSL